MERKQSKQKATQWHQIFAWVLRELLTEVGIRVQAELPLGDKPPQADLFLLRLSGAPHWTAKQLERLPDGIRHSHAQHILIEFKYSESFGRKAILQALVYDSLYRWVNYKLSNQAIQTFIVVSHTPRAKRRQWFGYQATEWSGVYHSDNVLLRQIPLIVLNQLSNEPHNLFFKLFGSRQHTKQAAAKGLQRWWWTRLSVSLLHGLRGLFDLWSMKGGRIMDELTVEDLQRADKEDLLIWMEMTLAIQSRTNVDWILRQPSLREAFSQEIERGIEQGIERGIEQGIERGIEKGQQQALIRGIVRTLTIRFEPPPAEWSTRLEGLLLVELERLSDLALTVDDLGEFAAHLPEA